jgi:phosphocarrier protein HPr
VEREVVIRNAEGLHMRPAMQFVDCASGFVSRISVYKGTQCVDGKSIMQMTMLAANKGTRLKISATGVDADKAVEALAQLFENQPTENVG